MLGKLALLKVLMVFDSRDLSRTVRRQERLRMMSSMTQAEVDDSIIELMDQIRDSTNLSTVTINDGSIHSAGTLYRIGTTAAAVGNGTICTIFSFIEVKSYDKYVETRRI